jgi:hypothetical protein
MSRSSVDPAQDSTVARTIRFPSGLQAKIAADAERCGRSFNGQVIALLRRHYGENVDIEVGKIAGLIPSKVDAKVEYREHALKKHG